MCSSLLSGGVNEICHFVAKKGSVETSDEAAKRKLAEKLKEVAAKDKAAADKKSEKSDSSDSEAKAKATKRRSKMSKRAQKRRRRAADRAAKSLAAARRQNKIWAKARADRIKRRDALSLRRFRRAAKMSEKLRSAGSKANRAKANNKLSFLHRSTAQSNTNILSINTDQYREYVMSGPRPYWLFVAFTALQHNYRCAYCAQMHDQFTTLAPAFHSQHNIKLPSTLEAGSSGGLSPSFAGAEGEEPTADDDTAIPAAGASGDFGLPGAGTSKLLAGVTGQPNNTREAGMFNGWWWVGQAEAEAGGNSAAADTFKTYPVFFLEVDIARNQDLFNALSTSTPRPAPAFMIMSSLLTTTCLI